MNILKRKDKDLFLFTRELVVRYNSFLIVFVVFSYGLCNVVSLFISFSIAISLITLLLVGQSFVLNMNKLSVKFLTFSIVIVSLLLFQYFIHPNNIVGTTSTLIYFLSIGVVGLFVGSNEINWNYIFHYMRLLAVVNFVLNIIYVRLSYDNIDTLSMRFAYGILPSAMFFLFDLIKNRSFVSGVIFLTITCLIFIWGSRGAFLVILIYLFFVLYKRNKLLLFIGGGRILLFSKKIISILLYLINVLPVESLKLKKMSMMLTEGILAASSGREELYMNYWKIFEENILFGCGVGFWDDLNLLYPHNLFLQAAVEFGILGCVVVICYVILSFFKIEKMCGDQFEFMIIVFSIMIGRLLVSSSYWERPEFWLCLSMVFFNRYVYVQRT